MVAQPRSQHKPTRAGWRGLLTYLAFASLGASLLTACTGQWPYPPWPVSATQSQASVSQLPSRPKRKHKPPPATDAPAPDAGNEVLATAAPAAAMPTSGPTLAFTPPASAAASSTTHAPATNSPSHQSNGLVGLDQPEVTRVLGAATEQFGQPPAMVWRYKNATCELDLRTRPVLLPRPAQQPDADAALRGEGGRRRSRPAAGLRGIPACRSKRLAPPDDAPPPPC